LKSDVNFSKLLRKCATKKERRQNSKPMGESVMGEIMSLRDLKKGQKAVIAGVDIGGEMGRRIRDMGLTPGVEVICVGRAPLRDPVALRFMGFTLTLRNSEASFVRVRAA
jgi:ferrous iron transport protein A